MPSPNSSFTEIIASTLSHFKKNVVADNVTDNNALLTYLKAHDAIEEVSGGRDLVVNLEYDLLNYQRYSGAQELDISQKDLFTAAAFPWQQAAVMVTATGLETRIQNAGPEQIFSLAKGRIKNAMKSAANNQSIDIYSSGALSNQIGGLGLLVQTNGQGTVGGIDSATYTFWRNGFRECTTAPAVNQTFLNDMNALYYTLVRGTSKPNLIVASHDFFGFVEGVLQSRQQYTTDTAKANIGFPSIMYKGIPMIFDSNSNFTTTQERAYFLNLDNIKFMVHSGTNWVTDEKRMSLNQDAHVVPLFWAGNLVISNRRNQGVLIDEA